jgi:hypothetical protein
VYTPDRSRSPRGASGYLLARRTLVWLPHTCRSSKDDTWPHAASEAWNYLAMSRPHLWRLDQDGPPQTIALRGWAGPHSPHYPVRSLLRRRAAWRGQCGTVHFSANLVQRPPAWWLQEAGKGLSKATRPRLQHDAKRPLPSCEAADSLTSSVCCSPA